MLASFEWHILWDRIFHPDHAFVLAMWRTVFIAVVAQVLGVVLGLVAALMRMSRVWQSCSTKCSGDTCPDSKRPTRSVDPIRLGISSGA